MTKLKIFIAGHKGMVGSALTRILKLQDVELITKDRKELNLLFGSCKSWGYLCK